MKNSIRTGLLSSVFATSAIALSLSVATPAMAQVTTSEINGTVTDASGIQFPAHLSRSIIRQQDLSEVFQPIVLADLRRVTCQLAGYTMYRSAVQDFKASELKI